MTHNNSRNDVRHVFSLVGTSNKHTQDLINKESNKYGDIVQQNFNDTYNNLTLKMLMMIQWSTEYCNNARYVVKIDSDNFVNLFNVKEVINQANSDEKLMGKCHNNVKPIRSLKSKWSMTRQQYQQDHYPPFCLGPRYVIPMKVASAVLRVASDTPMIRLEDVYLGMLLHKTPYSIKTIQIDRGPGFSTHQSCELAKRTVSYNTHGIQSVSMTKVWNIKSR